MARYTSVYVTTEGHRDAAMLRDVEDVTVDGPDFCFWSRATPEQPPVIVACFPRVTLIGWVGELDRTPPPPAPGATVQSALLADRLVRIG